ncbi:protein kinase [Aquabacterium sp.]|uniref:protein kinase n=1 Tax=Aquabacterium sp. TaxID=1872578 RepID=UPI002BE8E04B|nr:protein kinase [Aquabacterium sp.]HSW05511.1 protein kinase [Aquabacterium sp.]
MLDKVAHASPVPSQVPSGKLARFKQALGQAAHKVAEVLHLAKPGPSLMQRRVAPGAPPPPRVQTEGQGWDTPRLPLIVKDPAHVDHQKFEKQVVTQDMTLAQLPPVALESKAFKAMVADLVEAFGSGDADKIDGAFERLPARLHQALADPSMTASGQLALILADGRAFMDSLIEHVQQQAPNPLSVAMWQGVHKGQATQDMLQGVFEKALVGLGGQAKPLENNQYTITYNGRVYTTGEKPLGKGHFGEVQAYHSEGVPDLIVKVPVLPPEPPGLKPEDRPAFKRAVLLDGPRHEGRAQANALGTGASADDVALLQGALISDDGRLLLILRKAEFGSLDKFKAKIDAAVQDGSLTATDGAKLKLLLITDVLHAITRLQAARGEAHSDIALRNVLVDGSGHGLLSDFGLAVPFADEAVIALASEPRTSETVPVAWTSPESLTAKTVTAKSDSWMLGMMLVELAYDVKRPFNTVSNDGFGTFAQTFDPDTELKALSETRWPDGMAEQLLSAIKTLLQVNPDERADAKDVMAMPPFKGLSTDNAEVKRLRGKLVGAMDGTASPAPPAPPALPSPPAPPSPTSDPDYSLSPASDPAYIQGPVSDTTGASS